MRKYGARLLDIGRDVVTSWTSIPLLTDGWPRSIRVSHSWARYCTNLYDSLCHVRVCEFHTESSLSGIFCPWKPIKFHELERLPTVALGLAKQAALKMVVIAAGPSPKHRLDRLVGVCRSSAEIQSKLSACLDPGTFFLCAYKSARIWQTSVLRSCLSAFLVGKGLFGPVLAVCSLERSILHTKMRNLWSCMCIHLPAVQCVEVHLDQRVACHVHFGSQSISLDPGIQCQSFCRHLITCITCRCVTHVTHHSKVLKRRARFVRMDA